MIGERTRQTCDEVIALLEEGWRVFEICEKLRVNRRYVYRVQASFQPVYVAPAQSEELTRAKRELDRAYADFQRASNPTTYSALCDARRAYELAKD